MRLYLAAPWVCKQQAAEARTRLDAAGFLVSAPWIDQHEDTTDPAELRRQANSDIRHVRSAEAFVILNLDKSEGKATELGMALAFGIPIVLVGPRTINIFYHTDAVHQVETLEEAIDALHTIERTHPRSYRPAV